MTDRPFSAWLARVVGPPRGVSCTAATKQCDFRNWGPNYLRPSCCTTHLTELLVFSHELLDRHAILHWLDFGSLLGAVREGSIISWDDDVDFGVLTTDRSRIVALASEIERAGHFLDASDPSVVRICLSSTNRLHADLFMWTEREGVLHTEYPTVGDWPGMHGRGSFPASYLTEMGPVRLEGHSFPAPGPVDRFLIEHRFGPDYLVPTRPLLSWDLRPDIGPAEYTPVVTSLLAAITEQEGRLFALKAHPRLSHLQGWQHWCDLALPMSAGPEEIEAVRRTLAPAEGGPVVTALLHSLAILAQAIDELEHPTVRARLRRNRRRAERIAAKLTGRRSRSAAPPEVS